MKRFLSLVLAVVLVVGLTLPASAARKKTNKVASIDRVAFRDYMGNAAIYPDQTRPGDEIIIPIMPVGLRGDDGEVITDWHSTNKEMGPTARQLRQSGVEATLYTMYGSAYIRDIDIVDFTPTSRNKTRAAVRVRFKDDINSSKEITYQFEIYLALNGNTTPARDTFGGMVRNETFDVYNRDYLFIGDGEIAEASNTNMGVELDLGNGVSILRDMYRGDRFYGRAKVTGNEEQDKITAAYPQIHTVYDLTTIDVKFNGAPVLLTNERKNTEVYYVYNLSGEYIGTSHDNLPYSVRYYLSSTAVDIDPSLAEMPELSADQRKMGAALTQFVSGVQEQSSGYKDPLAE